MFVLHVVMFSGIDCQEIQELDKSKRFYNLLERFNQMYHFGNQTLNNKNLWTNIFEVILKTLHYICYCQNVIQKYWVVQNISNHTGGKVLFLCFFWLTQLFSSHLLFPKPLALPRICQACSHLWAFALALPSIYWTAEIDAALSFHF